MSNIVLVGESFDTLDVQPVFEPYSKVIIHVGTVKNDETGEDVDLIYRSPSGMSDADFDRMSGATMELTLSGATQATADAIYSRIVGHTYQPYELSGAVFDPAAELGDGIEAGTMYSVLASHDLNMTSVARSDSAAPSDNETDIEFPQLTANERAIERRINDVQATLRVDVDAIVAEITSARGDKASLSLRLDSITSEVQNAEGSIATIQQTVSNQSASIGLLVDSSGAQASIKIDAIVNGINGADTSVKINANHIVLDADKIQATGVLTWEKISGTDKVLEKGDDADDYITTITEQTVTAAYINALDITAANLRGQHIALITPTYDRWEHFDGYDEVGWLNLTDASSSEYAVELGSYGALRLVAGGGAFYIDSPYGSIGSFYDEDENKTWITVNRTLSGNSYSGAYDLGRYSTPWGNIYLWNEPIVISDRRQKTEIKYDGDKAVDLILGVRPCSFRFLNGKRTHYGMIAQDVEALLPEIGLTSMDFAGLVKSADGERYALRYGEFISPLIYTVQELWKKVENLEQGRNQ